MKRIRQYLAIALCLIACLPLWEGQAFAQIIPTQEIPVEAFGETAAGSDQPQEETGRPFPVPILVGALIGLTIFSLTVAAVIYLALHQRNAAGGPAKDTPPGPCAPLPSGQLPLDGENIASPQNPLSAPASSPEAPVPPQTAKLLRLIENPQQEKSVVLELLEDKTWILGRNPEFCDVVPSSDPSISNAHCKVYLQDEVVFLQSINNRPDTWLNGERAIGLVPLQNGDLVQLGDVEFLVHL